jgi:hypothetical protein
MAGVDAWRIVALVADHHPRRDGPVRHLPTQAGRHNHLAIRPGTDAYYTVATPPPSARPRPTVVRPALIDFRPEANDHRRAHICPHADTKCATNGLAIAIAIQRQVLMP